jgi:ferredoxin
VRVVAPVEVEPGVVDLAAVESAGDIALDYQNVRLPLKRVFFPITEVLLEYANAGDGDVDVRPAPIPAGDVVVIGGRPCGAAATEAMDKVFHWDYDDVRYSARRERTTLVTFACKQPAPECFCTSVGGSPHGKGQSDVLVYLGDDDQALMEVFTEKGQRFIDAIGDAVRPAPADTAPPDPPQIESKFDAEKVKAWLDDNFESDFWTDVALKCLGCGACSYLCPTCHCFDIVDEGSWNHGRRLRNWDCCSFSLFTEHASGHNPRPKQSARCRQRVMHKFKYYPERFGSIACVGCGRCIRVCGAGQNVVSILTEIESK